MVLAASSTELLSLLIYLNFHIVNADIQQCYTGPGPASRGPSNLVPCLGDGQSACCLLGDTCLSGNTCFNYATGDTYQYGCTDINYVDPSCPYKCGFNVSLSPWTALEYCQDVPDVSDTWVCHAPESCGCQWPDATYDLLELDPRGCKEMGINARVALYAPSQLAPYVSLPSSIGGTPTYYQGITINGTSTWISTAIVGYTPYSIGPLTTYISQPTSPVLVEPGLNPSPSTVEIVSTLTTGAQSASGTPTSGSTQWATPTPTTASASASVIPIPPNGLPMRVKAGIGIGAAFGACLIAAVAILAFLLVRNRRNQLSAPPSQQTRQHDGYNQPPAPQYSQPPSMLHTQAATYYGPSEKPGWQPTYQMGGQWMPVPYQGNNQSSPYSGPPTVYSDQRHSSDPRDTISQQSPTAPLHSPPPMELSADHRVPEVSGEGMRETISPTP